jgi:hypothetical protein
MRNVCDDSTLKPRTVGGVSIYCWTVLTIFGNTWPSLGNGRSTAGDLKGE